MTKHIVLGILTLVLAFLTLQRKPVKEFNFTEVEAIAQRLATTDLANREERSSLPLALSQLNYDQYRKLRWKDENTLWRKEGLPFQLKFFHRGHIFQDRVDLFAVSKKGVDPMIYHQKDFSYDDVKVPPLGDIGFAGFRIHYPLNKPDYLDELVVFQGASYFRALAKDLQYGLSARGLALNTGIPGVKEEFPRFSTFWVQQPSPLANHIRLWALLESKSVSGAYQFEIYPGIETVMLIRTKLYFKSKIRRLGIAPLTSMFWYGENSPDANRDWRPEVHDSDGLLVHKQNGEWLWRPLDFGRNQRENQFQEEGVKGFGLLQRDREFPHYQDLEANYSKRPSAWVETEKGFENGSVELIQLPTDHEYQDNVITYWSPKNLPKPGDTLEFQYRIVWYGNHAQRPGMAFTTQTFVEPNKETGAVRYLIDFAGKNLENETKPPEPVIITDPECPVSEVFVQRNEHDKSWRLAFTLARPGKGKKVVDIRALLSKENKPLTETWTYQWEL